MLSQLCCQPAAVSLRLPVQTILLSGAILDDGGPRVEDRRALNGSRFVSQGTATFTSRWTRPIIQASSSRASAALVSGGASGNSVRRRSTRSRRVPPSRIASTSSRVERATDDEAHAPVVADGPLAAAGGQRQCAGVEVAGQTVVAFGILKRRDVEHPDEVAILRNVLELPVALGSTALLPRIHDHDPGRLEVFDVPRRDTHAMHQCDCDDLPIRDVEPSACPLGAGGHVPVPLGGAFVKREDPAAELRADRLPEVQQA